jgi:hypothetical protein
MPGHQYFKQLLGPMLRSLLSGIFANFRLKIGVFLENQCYTYIVNIYRQYKSPISSPDFSAKIITSIPEEGSGGK